MILIADKYIFWENILRRYDLNLEKINFSPLNNFSLSITTEEKLTIQKPEKRENCSIVVKLSKNKSGRALKIKLLAETTVYSLYSCNRKLGKIDVPIIVKIKLK